MEMDRSFLLYGTSRSALRGGAPNTHPSFIFLDVWLDINDVFDDINTKLLVLNFPLYYWL